MPTQIRPFQRGDRDQLTALVNAHISAVVPGVSVSTQHLLSNLECEPDEFIIDPWVTERRTIVAEQRGRIVAAAHLLRYGSGPDVGEHYRDLGDIRWFVHWTEAPYWSGATEAATALMAECLQILDQWQVRIQRADGSLPAAAVYGIPDQWPHVRSLYEASGFTPMRTEWVLIIDTAELACRDAGDLGVRRSVGINGTRITVSRAGRDLGYIEVDTNLDVPIRQGRMSDWADIGNLEVFDGDSDTDTDVVRSLLGAAGDWLRLAGVGRLLGYAGTEDEVKSYVELGFSVLTRTLRGWTRRPNPPKADSSVRGS